MYQIFLVEDDPGIAEAIAARAAQWDLRVTAAQDFRNILPEFLALRPHLVLLNTGDGTLRFGERTLTLSRNEFRILLCLLENKGRAVSRERLMERLWQTDQFVDENTLTVNVNRLRKKLDALGLPDFIVTRFGVGYLVE